MKQSCEEDYAEAMDSQQYERMNRRASAINWAIFLVAMALVFAYWIHRGLH